ncbi:GNAT family N-acetyltransferase [Microvirga puerhi]|uniref:GNAT family N-acetyltransferase n=1 Tax=Microvirga puerhi TaxID=2876078 RepID=A0ABS7VRW9_9HYPH|nr:GNAT family N-acetyltransferase [Microvirga puerhi]MBZ6077805.1 GNAT family N-acetyltransferase [Microvirga puerhi]
MTYELELLSSPDESIHDLIRRHLREFNRTTLAPGLPTEDLAIVIREPEHGAVLGGLWGRTGRGWLSIELIFVPEDLRGNGIGPRLLMMAEAEGLRRDCHSAWLDTFNPDAAVLYERLGYVRFGELKDFPPGNSRIFLQKKLK